MKTTILTFALALATMPLTFAQSPAPTPAPAAAATNPAPTAAAKTAKKHHRNAAKKTVKTAPASTTPATVKQ